MSRFYLAAGATRFSFPTCSGLFRSDDDGRSWRTLRTFACQSDERPVSEQVGGLDYDPNAPQWVYLGLAGAGSGVQVSPDGGITWQALGRQDLGEITDLVLGIDAKNLYAATAQGVWRFRAPPSSSTVAFPYRQPGQVLEFVFGFKALSDRLGETMGEPLECEHAIPEHGDTLQ